MAVKFVLVFTSLVAAAHSSEVPLAHAEPELTSFGYSVAEPSTGDFKHQVETRVANTVRGQYSLLQPDGLKRIVDYFAGDDGFHAIVRYEPIAIRAPVVPLPFVPEPVVSTPILDEPIVSEPIYAEPEIRTPVVLEDGPAVATAPISVAEELPYTETVEASGHAFAPSSYSAPAPIIVEDRASLSETLPSLHAPGPDAVLVPGRASLHPAYYRNVRSSHPTAH